MAQKKITDLQLISALTDSVNIPGDDGIQSYRMTASQIRDYIKGIAELQSAYLKNVSITATAAASALTVSLKTKDGSANVASGNADSQIAMRSTTVTSGVNTNRTFAAGAMSVVIPSTATLGYVNGDDVKVYVYAIYDGTNFELAVTSQLKDERDTYSTTAISTSATSNALYSTTGLTGCAIRLIGEVVIAGMTTAGTWTSPTRINSQFNYPHFVGQCIRRTVITASGTTTFKKSPLTKKLFVIVTGSGAAGGGKSANTYRAGAGGSAGATAFAWLDASSITDSVTVTIGAKGTGVSGATGNNGATSSFGSYVSANGGTGGTGDTTNSTNGAAGATTTSGADYSAAGGPGGAAICNSTATLSMGGFGGASWWGGGGQHVAGNQTGVAATGYGSGGSGACNAGGNTASAGGDGKDGICLIEEYN